MCIVALDKTTYPHGHDACHVEGLGKQEARIRNENEYGRFDDWLLFQAGELGDQ